MNFFIAQELFHLTSDNLYLRIFIVLLLSGAFSYLVAIRGLLSSIYLAYSCWRNKTVTVEIKSECSNGGAAWVQNKTLHGLNHRLIEAVLSYISNDIASNTSFRKQIYLSNEGLDTGNFPEETSYVNFKEEFQNRLIFRPMDKITLSPPYEKLAITYRQINQKTEGLVTRTHLLTIRVAPQQQSQVKQFLERCYTDYCKRVFANYDDKQFFLITYYGRDSQLVCKPVELHLTTSFDRLFFPQKERLMHSLDCFLSKSDQYGYRKFSLLLHGPPGTGKTSVIKAIANYTKRHLHYVKLSTIKTFQDALDILFGDCGDHLSLDQYHQSITPSKKIVVFEDIDAESNITHKRSEDETEQTTIGGRSIQDLLTAKGRQPQLTLADVLQLFDGIIEVEGVMIIATTNHIKRLDPALIRKGRFTEILEMGELGLEEIIHMQEYYSKLRGAELSIKDRERIRSIYKDKTVSPAELEHELITNTF